MNEALRIERSSAPGTRAVLLRLAGTIDGRGGRTLMDACAPLRAEGLPVVLNCRGVSFVSSSGIGALLALTEDFKERGAAIWIAAPSPEVRMAIGLLNLESYLNLVDTEDGALERAAA